MISFKKYYFQQFKDIPTCWKLAKKYKNYAAFICSILWLLSPMAICTMWLYDTGQMKIDKRFYKKGDDMIGTNNQDGTCNGRADCCKGKN